MHLLGSENITKSVNDKKNPKEINIDDKSLIVWFSDNDNRKNISFLNPDKVKIPQRMKRLENLEKDIGKLEKDLELYKQRDVVKDLWRNLISCAVIFLKYNDHRERFHDDGDYGLDSIGEFFEEYIKFESLLYGNNESYRDHSVHVFRVFLVGEYILHHDFKIEGGGSKLNLDFNIIQVGDKPLIEAIERNIKETKASVKTNTAQLDDKSVINVIEKNIETAEASIKINTTQLDDESVINVIEENFKEVEASIKKFELKEKSKNVLIEVGKLKKLEKDKIQTCVKLEEKEAMWAITSLTHDLGYPLEKFHQMQMKIQKMVARFNIDSAFLNISQQNDSLNTHIIEIIASDLKKDDNKLYTHVQPKYLWKILKALENHDHGIESCILLFKTLVFFLETDYCTDLKQFKEFSDAKQFLIRQKILRAIASHNCNYIYHLKLFDFSFFLIIIDEIQEWSRPSLNLIFKNPPRVEVGIEDISSYFSEDKSLVYKISFFMRYNKPKYSDDTEKIDYTEENYVSQQFGYKCRKFIEILRSAVYGNERDFTLEYLVYDDLYPNCRKKYQFIHKNPDDITINKYMYDFDKDNNEIVEKMPEEIHISDIFTKKEYNRDYKYKD